MTHHAELLTRIFNKLNDVRSHTRDCIKAFQPELVDESSEAFQALYHQRLCRYEFVNIEMEEDEAFLLFPAAEKLAQELQHSMQSLDGASLALEDVAKLTQLGMNLQVLAQPRNIAMVDAFFEVSLRYKGDFEKHIPYLEFYAQNYGWGANTGVAGPVRLFDGITVGPETDPAFDGSRTRILRGKARVPFVWPGKLPEKLEPLRLEVETTWKAPDSETGRIPLPKAAHTWGTQMSMLMTLENWN